PVRVHQLLPGLRALPGWDGADPRLLHAARRRVLRRALDPDLPPRPAPLRVRRQLALRPARLEAVRGQLGTAVAREHTLEVERLRAVLRLCGREVGEDPDVCPGDEGARVRDVEDALDQGGLVL